MAHSEAILGKLAQRWPVTPGQRHANLFRVCAMANDLGIAQDEVRAFALRYAAQDFPEREIENILRDTDRPEQFGTKSWGGKGTSTRTIAPKWSPEETALIERMAQRMRETWATTTTTASSNTNGNTFTPLPQFAPSDTDDQHIPLVDYVRAQPHLQKVVGCPALGRADHSDRYLLGLVRDHLFGATIPCQHATAEALACFVGCSMDIAEQALQYIQP